MRTKHLLALGLIAALIYVPVLYGLKDAFLNDKGQLTLENIITILSMPSIQHALRFTLTQALISSAIATAVGSLAAFSLLTLGFRGARTLRALSMVSFMAPPMVVVTGFTALFGSDGWVSRIIPYTQILGHGFWAIVAAHVFYNIPLSLNFVYSSLVSIPREIIDSVNVFSYGRLKHVFLKVVLPCVFPALASSFTLTFIYCFTSFAIPLSLGGVKYSTLEVYIYYYYKIMFDVNKAAAIAFLQYVILVAVVMAFVLYHGKTAAAPVGYSHYRLKIPGWVRKALILYTLIVFAYLYIPLLSVAYQALHNPYTGEYGVSGFSRVLSLGYDSGLGTTLARVYLNTFYYALMTGVLALTISSIIVYFGSKAVDTVYVSLLAISPLTLSLGLLRAYGAHLPNPALIIMAHTIAAIPLVVRVLRIGIERVGKTFVEAAHVLGEHGLPLYMRIIYPLMKPSYLVALSLALVVSLGEFGATFFISSGDTITLGVSIYLFRGVRDWQASGAAAAILLALTSAILLILSRRMERWL